MKKTFLTALVAFFCVTAQAQINPKMQALFEQLKELEEPPRITKTGGAGDLVRLNYSAHLYYSPEMFSGGDSLTLDSLLQDERGKLKRQLSAIRHTLDQLQEEAQESYHYEYHQGGNDTIIYSMNLCQDTTRVLKYQSDNHTMFHSDEILWFSYQPYLPKKGFTGNLSYHVRVPDASLDTVPYTLTALTDDIARLFKQNRIKPRKGIWQHDKAYSDSIWEKNRKDGNYDDFIRLISYDGYSREGVTEATIYTVPRDKEQLAHQLFHSLDSLAQKITNRQQDFHFRYNYKTTLYDDRLWGSILNCYTEQKSQRECYSVDMAFDDFGFHFIIAQTRGVEWVPRNWPSIKTFINGEKTYFKGMKPCNSLAHTKEITEIK